MDRRKGVSEEFPGSPGSTEVLDGVSMPPILRIRRRVGEVFGENGVK